MSLVSSIFGYMGAKSQADAASKGADASAQAMREAIALQERMYNQTRADNEPWRQAGAGALGRISDPANVLANFQESPDYQFRLNEGNRNLMAGRATSGLLQSGDTLKAIQGYGQNMASGEFGDWWNRQAGLAGVGQTANAQNAGAGQSYANGSQNALQWNANNQASSYQRQANAWSGFYNDTGQAIDQAAKAFFYGG